MNKSSFAERHPYWFTTIIEIVVILVYLLAGTAAHFIGLSNQGLYGLANLALTVIVAILLTAMRWWKPVGYRRADRKSDLWYYLVPFLPMLINLIPGVQAGSLAFLIQAFAIALMVGFVEESVFRGLMLHAIQPRGLWKAAIITSLLFGVTHALNVLTGRSLGQGAAQVLYTVAIGFAFAALVLRKGIIWPLVLAHFLIDFTNYIQTPGFVYPAGWETGIVLGLTVVFAGYGLFVMLQRPGTVATQPATSS
jgi:membrane protease YdiL (CAAX protease family)